MDYIHIWRKLKILNTYITVIVNFAGLPILLWDIDPQSIRVRVLHIFHKCFLLPISGELLHFTISILLLFIMLPYVYSLLYSTYLLQTAQCRITSGEVAKIVNKSLHKRLKSQQISKYNLNHLRLFKTFL